MPDDQLHTTPEEIAARAIWDDRYPDEDWDDIKWLATGTEDGGNGRYLTITGHARAVVEALRDAGYLK